MNETTTTNEVPFTKGFVILAALYAAVLIISNILVGKIIEVGPITLTAGIMVFPLTMILSDICTNAYGYKRSMLCVRINFMCCIIFVAFTQLMLLLPHPAFWQGQGAYETVFNTTPRIVIASIVSYYFSDWLNSVVLSWMKRKFGGAYYIRSLTSSMLGQGLDCLMFFTIAFAGIIPIQVILTIAGCQYVAKLTYQAIAMPFVCKFVQWYKKREGIDVVDTAGTNYNPFKI